MEMNKEIDTRLAFLLQSYDVHTTLFSKIINVAAKRNLNLSNKERNEISWLIGSQVQLRYEIANLMGVEDKQAAEALFSDNKQVQYDIVYPSLSSFNHDWEKISPVLKSAILKLSNKDLFTFSKQSPEKKGVIFDLLSFGIQRESNSICRLILWPGGLI